MRRASKDRVDARVNDLVNVILDGCVLDFDLCEFVREREKEPGSPWHLADGETPLSYSQIRRYANRAEKVIQDTARTSRKRLLRSHVARRNHLYAKAVNQGDLRAAAGILKDLGELQGLYPARKFAPMPGGAQGTARTDEQTETGIAFILQRAMARADQALGKPPEQPQPEQPQQEAPASAKATQEDAP
jgi:hypothetical protein